jgi:lambda family phage tail tape measure protein
MASTSKRTVQFEFLVDADARQIDKFHDALKRMGDGSATSEKTLISLRDELQRFASISDKTENNLQAQISALTGASRNADLTRGEYVKLRREASALQQEYKLLTTNIVGLDKTYKVATQSAREFSQAQKDAAASAATAAKRQTNLYLNNSGTISAGKKQEFLAGTSGADNTLPAQYAQGSSKDYQQRITDLQKQASAVGMTGDEYRRLRLEISQLEAEYTRLTQSAGQAQATLGQLINAPIGNTFNKLTAQVARLKNGINDLNFNSTEYIATLTRVKELEAVASLRQNRLNTIADNQAYSGATLTSGYGAVANLPSLPNTLAADSLLVSELSARISNLDKGSELYLQTVKDLDIATKSQAASQGLLNRELNVGTETYNRITRRDAKLIDRNNYFNPQGTGAPQAEFTNGRFIAQPAPGSVPVMLQPAESTLLGTPAALEARLRYERDQLRQTVAGTDAFRQQASIIKNLELEYKKLTSSILEVGNGYATAAAKARQFTAEQLAAAQRSSNLYLNNSGQRSADAANRAQFLAGTYAGENSLPLHPNSEGGMQQRIRQLQGQASAVAMNEDEYRKLRLELTALEGQYKKLSLVETDAETAARRRAERSDKLKYVGRTVRNVAAAGFFGGPEALSGAAIGGLMGGPAGAEIGAGIGVGLAQVRMQATAVSNLVAELNLAKTTLAQVSTGQADYSQKLQFARQVSADYSVGLQATIEGYAKVTAAASANGLTLKETETIYKGLLASGVAFGASQDDLKSIITATTQILSKGKISAEELSGQLGERIPGAVAKFAQATGRPLAQLTKDLQDGKVKISDFVKFAKGQLNDYDAAAKLIGASPEKAGERLNLALTRMAETYGTFFQSVGAGFQDLLTGIVNWANNSAKAFIRVISEIRLFVNDLKFEVGVVNRFLDIDSKKSANTSNNNITTPYGSFSPQKPSAGQQSTAKGNGPMPYGSFSGPAKTGKTKQELDREKWLANSDAQLLSGKIPTQFGGNQAAPLLGDSAATDDKAAKKAEAEAKRLQALADKETQRREKLEADERRRAELLANNAIQLADRVFQHQQDLIRKRYDLENSLIEATRRAQEAALIGPAREALSLTNRLAALIEASKKSVTDGKEGIAAINQEIKSGKASAANSARYADVPYSEVGTAGSGAYKNPGTASGRYMQGSIGGRSTGPHYHVMRQDGKYYPTKSLDNFIEVDGRTLSSGFGGGGQEYGTPRIYSGHPGRHTGRDYAFERGSSLGLKNGATWVGNKSNTGVGDRTAFMTPDGMVYEIIHGKFAGKVAAGTARNQPVTPRNQPGVVSGLNRNIGDNGGVELSQADLKNAKEQQKLLEQNAPKILQQQLVAEILASTEGYRTQTKEIKDQQQELKMRNRLQMEGVKPQIVDQQMELNAAYRTAGRNLTQLQKNLLEINKESSPELYGSQVKAIDRVTEAYRDQIDAQGELNAYVNDRRDTFRMKESVVAGVDSYTNSIGTLNEAVTNLTQKGIGGLSTSLKELLMTGTTDFRAFARSLISDMMDIVLQQGIVSRLAQTLIDSFRPKSSSLAGAGIGFAMNSIVPSIFSGAGPVQFGAGGGGTAGFGMGSIVSSVFKGAGPVQFARGGVMTGHGPLRLQTYARGGIANSPQVAMFGEGSMPEAYVPLPDGKRIPVAVSYPAIPGIPTGGGNSAAQEQAGSIGGSTFERTDAVINRMVASARQESAARAAASVAASGGGTTRIQLETTRINSVDYVTLEQARGIADASSARSTARQQRALQANPSARRSVGI